MNKRANRDLIRLWTEPATRKTNDELYRMVALGDEDARQHMIEANKGLVIHRVDQFLLFMPQYEHLRDDLISAGFVGLTQAVNKMASDGFVDGANPTGCMAFCIQAELGRAIEAEEPIRVPKRTRKRKEDRGETLTVPTQAEDALPDPEDEEDPIPRFTVDPRKMRELRETLDACCECDNEREILRLREEGYVDREIAEMLGLPVTTTYVMRRTLYARFLELSGWKGEV